MQNVRSGWFAAAGPTSTGEAAAGPRPLWTQMIRWPSARTWSQNALPMSSSSRHGGPSCVYAFHAAISNVGRGGGHRVERRRQRTDRRRRVTLDQHVADAAELFDLAAGALHHLRRQRIGVGDDGDRRQHGDGGVAAAEDEVEPGVDPHARRRVVAARRLREAEPPAVAGAGLVLEEVGLDVDDELAAGEHGGRRRLLDRRLRRQRERAAGAGRRGARSGAVGCRVGRTGGARTGRATAPARSSSRPPRCCTRRAPSTSPPSRSSTAGTPAATSPTAGRWCRRRRACAGSPR